MKKFLLLSAAVLLTAGASAQTRSNVELQPKKEFKGLTVNEEVTKQDSRITESRWLNYAAELAEYVGANVSSTFMPLFPDSTIILGYDNGVPFSTWTHWAATWIQPTDMPSGWLAPGVNYQLDSTAIEYAYLRNTAPGVVDTLIIQLLKSDDQLLYPMTLTSGGTWEYQDVEYDYMNNRIQPSNVLQTITYALTEADSSSFNTFLDLATPMANLAGKRIGAAVTFRPGYSWVPFVNGNASADSLFGKNVFFLRTFEENGQGTAQTPYGTWSRNMSLVVTQEARYGMFSAASGWNGYFLPSPLYGAAYRYEHHSIWFRVTSDQVGVENVNAFGSVTTFPNPASDRVHVALNLKEAAAGVTVVVTDVLGREVMVIDGGNRAAGNHSVVLNAANLANGIYNCTVKSGAGAVSTKLMIAR